MNSTIQTKGVALVNISAISMSAIDVRVLELINATSLDVALNRAAKDAADGGDLFYRMCIHAATMKGLFTLPSDENGKYPAKAISISDALGVVSSDSTNSQRKYFSEIVRKGWLAEQAGYSPLDFPSVGALRKAVSPKKTVNISLEGDSINADVLESYKAAKASEAIAVEQAKAEQAKAEQAKAEQAKAEQEARAEQALAEQAKADAVAQIQVLQTALQGALYGAADERKVLRVSFPKTA